MSKELIQEIKTVNKDIYNVELSEYIDMKLEKINARYNKKYINIFGFNIIIPKKLRIRIMNRSLNSLLNCILFECNYIKI